MVVCSNCIMDSSDDMIEFDENGVCCHCNNYYRKMKLKTYSGKEGREKLNHIVKEIKECGANKEYNCIVGLSGGVDSSYTLYLTKKLGLNPLVVHLDNGWNTKTASKNISKLLKKLDLDLYTYVIDWEEFKDLQLSFLKASVIDVEAVTDHAIKATLFKTANKRGIKHIITGDNVMTEGIMPKSWGHNKSDYFNIKDIQKRFGKKKLKTYPILTLPERFYYQIIKGIRTIDILNYVDFNKKEVKEFIKKEFGWEDYGKKHGESTFTHFYQSYILPLKFNVDIRKAHLSALICAGQISREKALNMIDKEHYSDEDKRIEKDYVVKNLGLTEKEFDDIMKLPIKSHSHYKSNDKLHRKLRNLYLKLR
jgi:N-acetyl sugar amidotransferase